MVKMGHKFEISSSLFGWPRVVRDCVNNIVYLARRYERRVP